MGLLRWCLQQGMKTYTTLQLCQPRPSNKKLIPIKVLFHLKRVKQPILDHAGEKYLIFPIVRKREWGTILNRPTLKQKHVRQCSLQHYAQQPKVKQHKCPLANEWITKCGVQDTVSQYIKLKQFGVSGRRGVLSHLLLPFSSIPRVKQHECWEESKQACLAKFPQGTTPSSYSLPYHIFPWLFTLHQTQHKNFQVPWPVFLSG